MFLNTNHLLLRAFAKSNRLKLTPCSGTGINKAVVHSLNFLKEYTTQPTSETQGKPPPTAKVMLLRSTITDNARTVCSKKSLWTRSSVLQSESRESEEHEHDKKNNPSSEEREHGNGITNIGEGSWEEVYNGVLTTQLKLLKMFSIGTSIIGLSVQPVLYEKLGTTNLAIVVTLASMFGFFTFITPALIHWVSKKYVTKLEYDPESDMYAATTLSFFLKEKKIHFKVDDVIRPDIPGMFTSFLVNNQPLFVDPSMFDNVDHYSRIMGYDKPLDFSLDRDKKRK